MDGDTPLDVAAAAASDGVVCTSREEADADDALERGRECDEAAAESALEAACGDRYRCDEDAGDKLDIEAVRVAHEDLVAVSLAEARLRGKPPDRFRLVTFAPDDAAALVEDKARVSVRGADDVDVAARVGAAE